MERDYDDNMGPAKGIATAVYIVACFYLIVWLAFL